MPAIDDYFHLIYSDQPWLTEEFLQEGFAWQYKDRIFQNILAELEKRWRNGVPRTILDIGTFDGRFLHLARQAGWNVEGAELNVRAANFAEKQTGEKIHRVPAEEMVRQGCKFGAVVLTDVLEHIPFPQPLVNDLRGLLHPGGLVSIKVPHGPMQHVKEAIRGLFHPSLSERDRRRIGLMTRYSHVNHFSVRSLRLCLENAGFHGIDIRIAPPESLPASSSRTTKQAVKAAVVRSIYTLGTVVPGAVHTPMGLHLQAFAYNEDGASSR